MADSHDRTVAQLHRTFAAPQIQDELGSLVIDLCESTGAGQVPKGMNAAAATAQWLSEGIPERVTLTASELTISRTRSANGPASISSSEENDMDRTVGEVVVTGRGGTEKDATSRPLCSRVA
jgi:hypothetical protein